MTLNYAEIQRLKRLDFPSLIKSYGILLHPKGNGSTSLTTSGSLQSYMALCPFHEDMNPSLSVSKKDDVWLFHCFACKKGGTVIDFVRLKENLSLPQTYKLLQEKFPKQNGHKEESKVNPLELLKSVTDFYHQTFFQDKRGLDYLKARGMTSEEVIRSFKIGFVNGQMRKNLSYTSPLMKDLKCLGILNDEGNEFFYNSIVIPLLNPDGNVVSLYGRNISHKRHLYLKGPHQGLVNRQGAFDTKKVILTESILDALSLYELGIRNVIPCYGTGGFTKDHEELLRKECTKEVEISFDSDEAGSQGAKALAERLGALGIKSLLVQLPQGIKDLNDFLVSGKTKEDFESLKRIPLEVSKTLFSKETAFTPHTPLSGYAVTEDPGILSFKKENRIYRVLLPEGEWLHSLKVNLKLIVGDTPHRDVVDLYQERHRAAFAKKVETKFSLPFSQTEEDLYQIIDELEKRLAHKKEEDQSDGDEKDPPMTPDDKEKALSFLKDPRFIDRILEDSKALGHVGEEINILLGYAVSVSRKLKNPLALYIISQPGAGKTELQDLILGFTPQEDRKKLTRLTDQSLFYAEKNSLKHKLLALVEADGAKGAAYSLRHLLGGQGLTNMTTIKNEQKGSLSSQENEVKGPTSVMLTTTNPDTDYETLSRFIVTTSDESKEQTDAILKRQRKAETLEGLWERQTHLEIRRLHRNAQRLLRPLEIVNPYSERLTFTDNILRARREQKKYLTLIKAIAFLRQYQKELKELKLDNCLLHYIEVDKEDIRIANLIARETLLKGLSQMTIQTKKVLPLIKELVDQIVLKEGLHPQKVIISRRDIREHTTWSDYQLRKHLHELEELEYLIPVQGQNGKRFTYILMWDGTDPDRSLTLKDME